MSLKTLHQVIIFAGIAISLIFAGFCFLDPSTTGNHWFIVAGIGSVLAALALVGYEIHFLKKTRRLVL
jgi:hypothetical protein